MQKFIIISLAPVLLAGCFGSEPVTPAPTTPAATVPAAPVTTPQAAVPTTPAATPTAEAPATPPAVFTADAFVGLTAELLCLPKLQPSISSDQTLIEQAKILQKYGATEANIAAFRQSVQDSDKESLRYKVLGKAEELCQISQQAPASSAAQR